MPKPQPPPTRVQQVADALIAAPRAGTFEELRAAIRGIKKIYYAALGNVRRSGLRRRLDEHYLALIALTTSSDAKLAARARRALPPVLLPKGAKTAKTAKTPKKRAAR